MRSQKTHWKATQNVSGGSKSKVPRVSTPVRTKVQRYEAMSKQGEIGKTLRKVKKLRDKPGEGAQCSIKKFLQRVENVEEIKSKVKMGSPISKGPHGPLSHGATARSESAKTTSRLTAEPSVGEGGKKAGGRLRDRTRSGGTLGRWLLLGKKSRPPAPQDTGRDSEKEGSLESRGGNLEKK